MLTYNNGVLKTTRGYYILVSDIRRAYVSTKGIANLRYFKHVEGDDIHTFVAVIYDGGEKELVLEDAKTSITGALANKISKSYREENIYKKGYRLDYNLTFYGSTGETLGYELITMIFPEIENIDEVVKGTKEELDEAIEKLLSQKLSE